MRFTKIRAVQTLFSLLIILFGLNGFFSFLPIPQPQGFPLEFLMTLGKAKYIFPTVALIMISAGILLLMDRAAAFGLTILLPVTFNIFAFHLLHERHGLIAATLLFAGNLLLIFRRREQFNPLFTV